MFRDPVRRCSALTLEVWKFPLNFWLYCQRYLKGFTSLGNLNLISDLATATAPSHDKQTNTTKY